MLPAAANDGYIVVKPLPPFITVSRTGQWGQLFTVCCSLA